MAPLQVIGRSSMKFLSWFPSSLDFMVYVEGEVSRDLLDPLAPQVRSLERVREILCLAHDLPVAELHNAHRVCWSPLLGDDVFGDPDLTFPEDSPDVET
jgi:hypothetical protein